MATYSYMTIFKQAKYLLIALLGLPKLKQLTREIPDLLLLLLVVISQTIHSLPTLERVLLAAMIPKIALA